MLNILLFKTEYSTKSINIKFIIIWKIKDEFTLFYKLLGKIHKHQFLKYFLIFHGFVSWIDHSYTLCRRNLYNFFRMVVISYNCNNNMLNNKNNFH